MRVEVAREVIGELIEYLVDQGFIGYIAPLAPAQRVEERVAEIVAPSLEWNDAALAKAVEEFKVERGQTLQRFPAETEPVKSRLFQHR